MATEETVGRDKADVAADRVRAINPACAVTVHKTFFLPDTRLQFDFSRYDYVVDAIDTVTGKLTLIEAANAAGVPIISCMGAGNKLDPTAFRAADLYETSGCPLARIMRRECRKRGIERLNVVYSPEKPIRPQAETVLPLETGRRDLPGSIAFVPAAAGWLRPQRW